MKRQKLKSSKGAKWHGNEEQMNIYVYHMLQSLVSKLEAT